MAVNFIKNQLVEFDQLHFHNIAPNSNLANGKVAHLKAELDMSTSIHTRLKAFALVINAVVRELLGALECVFDVLHCSVSSLIDRDVYTAKDALVGGGKATLQSLKFVVTSLFLSTIGMVMPSVYSRLKTPETPPNLGALLAENSDLEFSNRGLEARIETLQGMYSSSLDNAKALTQNLDDEQKAHVKTQEELSKCKADIETLEKALEGYRVSSQSQNIETLTQAALLDENSTEIATLKERCAQLEKQLREVEEAKGAADNEIVALRGNLRETNERVEELERDIERISATNERLLEEAARAREGDESSDSGEDSDVSVGSNESSSSAASSSHAGGARGSDESSDSGDDSDSSSGSNGSSSSADSKVQQSQSVGRRPRRDSESQ